jgi:hypothetical protein
VDSTVGDSPVCLLVGLYILAHLHVILWGMGLHVTKCPGPPLSSFTSRKSRPSTGSSRSSVSASIASPSRVSIVLVTCDASWIVTPLPCLARIQESQSNPKGLWCNWHCKTVLMVRRCGGEAFRHAMNARRRVVHYDPYQSAHQANCR